MVLLCLTLFLQPELIVFLELLVNLCSSRRTIAMIACSCRRIYVGFLFLALGLFGFLLVFYVGPAEQAA